MTRVQVLSVQEAINYQRDMYGRVAYGRDFLYRLAKSGTVPVIWVGKRKLLIPISTIDTLMRGHQASA